MGPRMRLASCMSFGTAANKLMAHVLNITKHLSAVSPLTDGDSLGMNSAKVAVFQQVHNEVFSSLQTCFL